MFGLHVVNLSRPANVLRAASYTGVLIGTPERACYELLNALLDEHGDAVRDARCCYTQDCGRVSALIAS